VKLLGDGMAAEMIIAIKNYWDDGRGHHLVRYAVFVCAIALVEWLLQVQNLFVLWYYQGIHIPSVVNPLFGYPWFAAMILLAIAWVAVVVIAFRKCGWPAMILLLSLPWGIRLFASMEALLEGTCFFFQGCP
jgi:hypothetical protein